MSRAINLSMPEAEVTASCHEAGVSISVTETLVSGGTHLVCTTGEGAEEMRRRHRREVILERVKRFPFYRVSAT